MTAPTPDRSLDSSRQFHRFCRYLCICRYFLCSPRPLGMYYAAALITLWVMNKTDDNSSLAWTARIILGIIIVRPVRSTLSALVRQRFILGLVLNRDKHITPPLLPYLKRIVLPGLLLGLAMAAVQPNDLLKPLIGDFRSMLLPVPSLAGAAVQHFALDIGCGET